MGPFLGGHWVLRFAITLLLKIHCCNMVTAAPSMQYNYTIIIWSLTLLWAATGYLLKCVYFIFYIVVQMATKFIRTHEWWLSVCPGNGLKPDRRHSITGTNGDQGMISPMFDQISYELSLRNYPLVVTTLYSKLYKVTILFSRLLSYMKHKPVENDWYSVILRITSEQRY